MLRFGRLADLVSWKYKSAILCIRTNVKWKPRMYCIVHKFSPCFRYVIVYQSVALVIQVPMYPQRLQFPSFHFVLKRDFQILVLSYRVPAKILVEQIQTAYTPGSRASFPTVCPRDSDERSIRQSFGRAAWPVWSASVAFNTTPLTQKENFHVANAAQIQAFV